MTIVLATKSVHPKNTAPKKCAPPLPPSLLAVDVHGAGAADALAAGAAERQAGVLLVLDLEQHVQHHRPARVRVHLLGVAWLWVVGYV